jgi:uncharacterized protein YdhG (YjbR/CyaY superfamily)
VRSDAATVAEYLADLPDDRRAAIETVRGTIVANLDDGFEEAMNWGMITYQVPLEVYADTYNDKPLMYAGLASQKRHMAVYLNGVYTDQESADRFTAAYEATGKKLDMGKSCVRFKRLDDLPLDLIGEEIAAYDVDGFIARYETARAGR